MESAVDLSVLATLLKFVVVQVFWIIPLVFLWPRSSSPYSSRVPFDILVYRAAPRLWPREKDFEEASYLERKDNALRFAAFANNAATCAYVAVHLCSILPVDMYFLAGITAGLWMVYVTSHSRDVWRCESRNTTGTGIFFMLCLNVFSGILLLCATREKPIKLMDQPWC